MKALIADHVTRRYDGLGVVDDVSLALQPGCITALLGGSGAGKSTLLRLFAGLEPVDAGRVLLGNDVLSSTERTVPAEKRRIGLIFQDFALFPHLTAVQNVAFGLKPKGRSEALAEAAKWLERMGLSGRADAYPHELSGGEQQRVAIARALAPQPAAILMDEPFSGLDPSLRGSVREAALEIVRQAGIPALLVTHDPAEALESADQIAIMRAGHLLQQGAAEDVYLRPVSPEVAAALGSVNRVRVGELPAILRPAGAAESATLITRPEGVILDPDAPEKARIVSSHMTGPLIRLVLDLQGLRLTALTGRGSAPAVGTETGVRFDPALSFVFA